MHNKGPYVHCKGGIELFMNRLRRALTKPENLDNQLEYRIIDAGFLAFGIIFIPYLISIEKPDQNQTISLVSFCIAVPFLAFHLFITQAMEKPSLPVSAYLAKIYFATFLIGTVCTIFGIGATLHHYSLIVSYVFSFCFSIVILLFLFIYKDREKAAQKELDKLESKIRGLEVEEKKIRNPKLEQDTAMKALLFNPLLKHPSLKIRKK
jgi:hypothetical protein